MDSKLGRRHEILGILCFAASLIFALSLWSYDLRGGDNLIGPFGDALARALAAAFGWAAWVVPAALLVLTRSCFTVRARGAWLFHALSAFMLMLLGCAFLHLLGLSFHGLPAFGGHLAGGSLGELIGEILRSVLGLAGAYVVCAAALMIALMLVTSFSLVGFAGGVYEHAAAHGGSLGKLLLRTRKRLRQAWRAAEVRSIERQKRNKPRPTRAKKRPSLALAADGDMLPRPSLTSYEAILLDEPDEVAVDAERAAGDSAEPEPEDADSAGELASEPPIVPRGKGPVIVAPRLDARRHTAEAVTAPRPNGPFVLPPTSLLAPTPESTIEIDEPILKENATRLEEKLAAYGVKGRVDEIHPGPVVTMYEFEPQSGTKISKIAGLSDDLAMALAAQKVRIVAPIPGKARVGFELPNEQRETVYLRELLEDERWHNLQSTLPLAFGKDIVGQPVYGDLSKMPHLLVAGATGSGKSVGLNVMLASLLMKKAPADVRLLMIDPKVVELAVFDGIPHMLLPVVTDMKKASLALRWAVDEMERRYQLFADAGARNLQTYNHRVDKVLSGEMSVATFAPRRVGKVRAQGPDGEELLLTSTDGEHPDAESFQPERLPSIVLVVDEFADLMMVAAKDVESAIARLAQKARAAGIHVILATQRPSVDVITGMIKANFPSRIGYKVSQREDSKTILGRTGAEHLLGLGDMLCLLPGSNDLKRVHSAYISEDEVKALCDYLRLQGAPVYDDDILKPRDDEEDGDFVGQASDDPLYDRAVAIVAQAGYCSISHIQRNLNVGYNKAAKMVERMEREGVVGPASGKAGGRREVFIEAR
jgi:S-DNA-T family DNA segregation ATPase FtsK/SpoIIIE